MSLPDCAYFPSYSLKCVLCFIVRHLITLWHLNIWKLNFSQMLFLDFEENKLWRNCFPSKKDNSFINSPHAEQHFLSSITYNWTNTITGIDNIVSNIKFVIRKLDFNTRLSISCLRITKTASTTKIRTFI